MYTPWWYRAWPSHHPNEILFKRLTNSRVAIEMIWDWGFTWKNIDVRFSKVAINATGKGKDETSKLGQEQSTGVSSHLQSR
jgi:hypothetical protein